ncbi:hypothetical protein BDFB_008852 [Asbolus verrucosus]|uniref:Uncharacterized protein n=1 Tax=Asbolus verrucosus TaxID=1661398 RepID=A0A482W3G8_ASBVE|nr:hypothetical protein BDFB_008852 [Asbolus verrucosus]
MANFSLSIKTTGKYWIYRVVRVRQRI